MVGRGFFFGVGVEAALAVAALLLCQSCATKKDILALHAETIAQNRQVESRLDGLERSVATLDSMTREQYRLMMGTRAIVGNQSQNQQDQIQSLSARLDNIYYLMKELNQKLQAIQLYGGVESAPPKTASPSDSAKTTSPALQQSYNPIASTANVDPNEVYNQALDDLNKGNYDLAESRFMAFLIQFPHHELAGNAQYWLGEVDYTRKKYQLAITEFEKVVRNYPSSDKVPAALLKMAFAHIELGKTNTGITILRQITKDYKDSEEAKLARVKLKKLGR
jgi:tol-pal system protein YbgF